MNMRHVFPVMIRGAFAVLVFLVATSGGTMACESGHWIDHVSDDGSVVVLEDGSVWLVDRVDQIDSALWLPTDGVVACAGRLIDTDDGTAEQARRISDGQWSGFGKFSASWVTA